jgi:TatD DNase family protein
VLIDTHCHLDAAEFDADRAAVLAAARAGGVKMLVVPSVERANFAAVASLARAEPDVAPAFGIHPMYVDRAEDEDLGALVSQIERTSPVAVGEIGLDRFVEARDDARQERYFVAQLELARRFDLPVLLHVRRAVDQVLYHLRRQRVAGGIAHAFNGSAQQAAEFIKLGFKLGVGGTATFSGSTRVRGLVRDLPQNAIVLETDAPDIPPAWLGGARNAPAELPRIAAVVAELRGTTAGAVADFTTANACAVLPRLAYHSPHAIH